MRLGRTVGVRVAVGSDVAEAVALGSGGSGSGVSVIVTVGGKIGPICSTVSVGATVGATVAVGSGVRSSRLQAASQESKMRRIGYCFTVTSYLLPKLL